MPPPSKQLIIVLVIGMLVTGSSNSLWSKFQDMQCVANCEPNSPAPRKNYEQPVWQSGTMFSGEVLCLLAFHFINSRFNPFRPHSRRQASASARKAVLEAHNARLSNAPLSRPDESAIFFNESAISLHNEPNLDSDGLDGGKDDYEEGEEKQKSSSILFLLPAAADICGTTCMNVGLLFVPVSVYQMLRGALTLWVALLSFLFLKRRLTRAQVISLATIMGGVAIVGLSSLGGKKEEKEEEESGSPLVGIILILVAQCFTATQFTLEEVIMEKHSVEPLLAVGYEGSYGLAITLVAIPILHLLIGSKPSGEGGYFDMRAGFSQIVHNPSVWGSSIIIAISIAFFNFCGLAVTSTLSATARSTVDTSRTVCIWVVSLLLGWEHFKWLQVVGFALLVYGTFIFNGITRFPDWTGFHKGEDEVPQLNLPSDDEEDELEDDSGSSGRSRSVDASGRPVTRRSGSGRRGEISPLLKNVGE